MDQRFLDIISGRQGVIIINDTTEYVGTLAAIYVLEDTVFNSLKIAGIDVKSVYITTAATAVKAGALIVPKGGVSFSAVDLTSGSVAGILKSA